MSPTDFYLSSILAHPQDLKEWVLVAWLDSLALPVKTGIYQEPQRGLLPRLPWGLVLSEESLLEGAGLARGLHLGLCLKHL